MKCFPSKGEIARHMPKTRSRKAVSVARPPTSAPEVENRYFSRAVGKALGMLELLSRSSEPLSLSQVSSHTQLTKTSAFRLLQTLEALHYIRRDSDGHYLASSERSGVVSAQFMSNLIHAAKEPMRQLNMDFGETVSLSMLMQNHIEAIHVVESSNLIRMSNIVGRILPPHASSMGKMITAFQDAETRNRLLQSYGLTRFTKNTFVDERALEDEFKLIRERGYSTDAEETTLGGSCFGVGIASAPSTIQAALSLSMPTSRMPTDEAQLKRMIEKLKDVAGQISEQLIR